LQNDAEVEIEMLRRKELADRQARAAEYEKK
jgi:hypothetical protein